MKFYTPGMIFIYNLYLDDIIDWDEFVQMQKDETDGCREKIGLKPRQVIHTIKIVKP